jgi:hypothetical protein
VIFAFEFSFRYLKGWIYQMMLHWQMFSTLAALMLFASDAALAIPQRGGGYAGDHGPSRWDKRTDDFQRPNF